MPRKSIVLIQKGVPNNVFIKINNNLKKLVKVMSNKRFIYFILIILATNVSFNVFAQKSRITKKAATTKITSEDQAQMLYETMLPSTEQIMIIDSIIADKNNFLNKIPLTKESGSVKSYNNFWKVSDQAQSYTYMNEFGNKVYFSKKMKQAIYDFIQLINLTESGTI